MKLGDTCSIKDVIGIVTYLDSDNNLSEYMSDGFKKLVIQP